MQGENILLREGNLYGIRTQHQGLSLDLAGLCLVWFTMALNGGHSPSKLQGGLRSLSPPCGATFLQLSFGKEIRTKFTFQVGLQSLPAIVASLIWYNIWIKGKILCLKAYCGPDIMLVLFTLVPSQSSEMILTLITGKILRQAHIYRITVMNEAKSSSYVLYTFLHLIITTDPWSKCQEV